jgi:predicted O-linked N-acetylglucosamine transferase (SPINDLY family)
MLREVGQHLNHGRYQQAENLCRAALDVEPKNPFALRLFGELLLRTGQARRAIEHFERAIAVRPGYVDAHFGLGSAHERLGDFNAAEGCFRSALKLNPGWVAGYDRLAILLANTGRTEEAVACYEHALRIDPNFAELYSNLGNVFERRREFEPAIACYRKAIALKPKLAPPHNNLASVLNQIGKHEAAISAYKEAIAIEPRLWEPWSNLGGALRRVGRLIEAEEAYRSALSLKPDNAEPFNNLGTLLKDCGKLDESRAAFRKALELKPDFAVAQQNLLMAAQYDPAVTPASLLEEHVEFDRRFARPLIRLIKKHDNVPEPNRRLRIGYVSSDLGVHPVGYFLVPVLPNHDRGQVEVFAYSDRAAEDDMTRELRAGCDHWRAVNGIADGALVAKIRSDRIDILVDLSGHTANNRLLAFARKPAPVQATWAGYVGTTGLSAMDYLITDARETPPRSDANYVERLALLPDCYVCYRPPSYAPDVGPLPARTNGYLTFGCFNNIAKINRSVIGLWTDLLRRIPDARLVLKTHQLSDPAICRRYAELFAAEGLNVSRLHLQGKSEHRALLDAYNTIDIALDPFPYSGGLTTLESLWMGVPVVTLGGDTFAARHSLTHLTAAGLTELIADGPDSYLRLAGELATNLPRLEALRSGLRARLAVSPLLDGLRFTRNLENAYREMWRSWCATQGGSNPP